MTDDTLRPSATGRDEPRQTTTSADEYTLLIEEAALRYEHAGYPRTLRSIQRYCAKGHLDCLRQETTFGDRFMITPQSVARHIAQIDELASATRRGLPRQDATAAAAPAKPSLVETPSTPGDVQPRPVATSRAEPEAPAIDPRYVQQLERENTFLRDQIGVKDAQISELGVRARETNILIKGLQDLFLALNPGRSDQQTASGNARPASEL